MKLKIKYLIVFFGFMFIAPLTSQAQCSYERQAELSRIASNVQFSYTYEFEGDIPLFNAHITNITNDIYIYTNDNLKEANGNYINKIEGSGEKSVRFADGTNARFDIYSADKNCYGEKLLTQYLDFPIYNTYSPSEECKKYPNFKYCQMWTNTSVDTTQFTKELENYKRSIEALATNTNEKNWFEYIKEEILKPNIVIPSIVLLIGAIITAIFKIIEAKRKVV